MGYDLHITRADNWFNNSGCAISEADWRNIAESDPELHLTGYAEVKMPGGETLSYESPLLAEWRGHPEGIAVWFDYQDGNIVVKNPDEVTILKMQEIAGRVGGRVQGDEGEFYDSQTG